MIRIALMVVGLTLAVASVACGGGDDNGGNGGAEDYPDSVIETFMDSCVSGGGTESQCQCALDEIEAEYALDEFIELSLEIANSGELPDELVGPIVACLGA